MSIPSPHLFSDGAYNPTTHPYGWASVVDPHGQDILALCQAASNPPEWMTNTDWRTHCGWQEEKLGPYAKEEESKRMVVHVFFPDVDQQQNNGAELIALILALWWALQHEEVKEIRCDSQIVLHSWSKTPPTVVTKTAKDRFRALCTSLRAKWEAQGGKIVKITGDENRADLGFHKPSSSSSKATKRKHPLAFVMPPPSWKKKVEMVADPKD